MKREVAMFFAPLVFNAAALCYLIRGRPMSTTPSHTPTTVSLADEEAVRRILVDTLFGLWATVNNLTRPAPVAARALSRDGVRVRAHRAGALGL